MMTPFLSLKEGEDIALSEDCGVMLVRDHQDLGPAVFLYGKYAAVSDLLAYTEKIVDWLLRMADHADKGARTNRGRFDSLADAQKSEAANYRATAGDGRAAIAKADARGRTRCAPNRNAANRPSRCGV